MGKISIDIDLSGFDTTDLIDELRERNCYEDTFEYSSPYEKKRAIQIALGYNKLAVAEDMIDDFKKLFE